MWPDWSSYEISWWQISFKICLNIWWLFGLFWKSFLWSNNYCGHRLVSFWKNWATFYINIWSHWRQWVGMEISGIWRRRRRRLLTDWLWRQKWESELKKKKGKHIYIRLGNETREREFFSEWEELFLHGSSSIRWQYFFLGGGKAWESHVTKLTLKLVKGLNSFSFVCILLWGTNVAYLSFDLLLIISRFYLCT